MQVTSSRNPLLQEIRQAAAGGRPTAQGWIVIEGPHLLREARRSRWKLGSVVTTAAGRERHAALLSRLRETALEVPARVFAQVASTESSQEILGLVQPPEMRWEQVVDTDPAGRLLVVLDGIQDPGNAGTIVRSAEAFGATGVLLLDGCVGLANGKFLRASAGSVFRVPLAVGVERRPFIAKMNSLGGNLYALTARGERTLGQTDLRSPFVLLVGSEGGGISAELLAMARGVAIPTRVVESLNAAVAGSLALFEAARQRGLTDELI